MANSLQPNYTLHIPGLGTSTAQHVSGLRISGMSLEELVVRVMAARARTAHQEVLWLDIERPSMRDVDALAKVFRIRHDIAVSLVRGVDTDIQTHAGASTHRLPTYACRCYPDEVYMRWAEWEPKEQCSCCVDETKLASAACGIDGSSNSYKQRSLGDKEKLMNQGSMLERGKSRLRKAIQRLLHTVWPLCIKGSDLKPLKQGFAALATATATATADPSYKQQEMENSRSSLVAARTLSRISDQSSQIGERFRKQHMTGMHTSWVQVWMGRRVLLTFHQRPSHAVTDVLDELTTVAFDTSGDEKPVLNEEYILQALICRWVRDSGGQCTGWLNQAARRTMSTVTTQAEPVDIQWVRTVASWRRLNLAALRSCQEGLRMLRTLRLLRGQTTTTTAAAITNDRSAHLGDQDGYTGQHNKKPNTRHWREVSFTHIPTMSQISKYNNDANASTAVYNLLYNQQKAVLRWHQEIERRLVVADSLALARQRQWLLVSGKTILEAANIWLLAHLIYAPLDFWMNINNINGTMTPGEGMKNSTLLFYWQLLAFAAWAIVAYYIYTTYVNHLLSS
ncbi:hypothetical protein IW138_003783 [Coemansia sp. RSA 986]|nr:hypothetical protein IW138_003783 [Coemansia sp. RSA 986]